MPQQKNLLVKEFSLSWFLWNYHLPQAESYFLDVFVVITDFTILGSNSEIFIRHGLLKFVNWAKRFSFEIIYLET